MSEALRTVIPLAGRLCSGEVGILLDPPVAEGDQIEEPVLSPDDWADLRRARPDQYGNHLGAPRAHVDQAQRRQGRACVRCGHAAHVAMLQGRRA